MLLYLYYALDNRGGLYRLLFKLSAGVLGFVSNQQPNLKKALSDLISHCVYVPLVGASRIVSAVAPEFSETMPLSYYANKSFNIIRNDALDRFGTP
jgi:hypothetical protein